MAGLSTSPAFYARLLCDHLVVVDRARSEMRVLNPSASALWLLLDEMFYDLASLFKAWQKLLQINDPSMESSFEATINEWSDLGWLEKNVQGYRITHKMGQVIDPLRGRGVSFPRDVPIPNYELVTTLNLKLSRHFFVLQLGTTGKSGFPETLNRLRAVLGGLITEKVHKNPINLMWMQDGQEFWLATPQSILRTSDESLALSSVVTALFKYAYSEKGMFATMHAAALSNEFGSVLLPGISGSGKSTLSAYLAAHGWTYFGDDVIPLGRPQSGGEFEIYPFPTAIGVKQGSWEVLRPYYPEVYKLRIVPYANRKARFLTLPKKVEGENENRCIRAIVLPRYCKSSAVEIELMEPVNALCDLIEAGVTTGESLHPKRISILLDMIETVPVYRLKYGRLEEAQQELEKICTS
jgi:hypothetical protein